MDLAENDLNKIIWKNKHQPMTIKEFFPIFRDTILGLVYMHSNAIAHRDIKPGNILLTKSGKFVIVDYGEGINLAGEESYNDNNFKY